MDKMKRWTLGGLGRDHLELAEVPVPTPGPKEILVEVRAVSLNYRDKLVIEGALPGPSAFPFTPASDMAGRVVAAGAEVTRFRTGDRVISTFEPGWIDGAGPGTARAPGYPALGGGELPGVLAEYVVLPEDWAVAAPARIGDGEASTLPCAGLTAWFALVERGALRAKETVVVHGTGGVAMLGLQIAVAHGAEGIVISRDRAKLDRALELGARHAVDRTSQDWVEEVLRATGGRGADHILEIVGGSHLDRSIQAAAVGGRISLIGTLAGSQVSGGVYPIFRKRLTIQGIGVGHRRALEDLVRAVDRFGMRPVVGAEYGFAELPAALDHLDRGPFGKIVVKVAA